MDDSSPTVEPRMAAPRPTREWKPAPPKSVLGFSVFSAAVVAAVVAFTFVTASALTAAIAELGHEEPTIGHGLKAIAAVSLLLFWPAIEAVVVAHRAQRLVTSDVAEARAATAEAKEHGRVAIGWAAAVAIVMVFGQFLVANEIAVGRTFFDVVLILETFALVGKAFWVNVEIFTVAEILVLVWGLIIAVARLAPGRAGAPLRFIATAYVDLFRGLPAIIAIYLVGFGLPLALPISEIGRAHV